ncbi:MAG: hypothetical protein F6K54_32385 [Okeania sp. SIO3B5]|uniref:hypothetical protein n=1 Tax=Okeania sp. SIO3B5 TaxID=2607811 RepID=UPI0013FE85B3|nr:hypothetical protein [Okeania sp. SIO3B5]NEO57362.1 hypothetical protein [Okeania sp. SIO3B5]
MILIVLCFVEWASCPFLIFALNFDTMELPEGWDGEETCAISNGQRENKVQYFKPLTLTRGTDN